MGLAKFCVCVCGHEEPLFLMEQVAVAHSPVFCLVFDATRRCVSLKAVKPWGGVKVRDRSLLSFDFRVFLFLRLLLTQLALFAALKCMFTEACM